MRSFLKFAATFILLGTTTAEDAELVKRDNITLKAPVIAVPSEHWWVTDSGHLCSVLIVTREGVDGTWSTFEIRVGTPAQTVRVLPATSWQETWVVWGAAAGVCNTTLGVASDCADLRGTFFESSASSTWENNTQNFLGLDQAKGYSGEAQYGFDTVGLGYTASDGPSLTHQIVAEFYSDTWWFGMLGLGFQPTNFSTYGNPQASFSDTLYSNGTISSMSWSYTAGAYYRLKSVFGSLIFGGYDASKFTPNDVIFNMTGDNLRDIVVTIRSITSTTASGNTTLMSDPEFAFIDSTVPELWLPTEVCQQFEKAFGLTLDPTSELYLINASTHTNLQKLNPNITITLANQKTGGPTTDIVLPYDSFDLNITAPLLPNTSSLYFPIRQTDDSGLYTLGRTFLQEAYVVTHYNSRTFNVSQCIFDEDAQPHVLALPPVLPTPNNPSSTKSTTPTTSTPKKKSISAGVIAGIVLGCLLGLACVALITALLVIRRRRKNRNKSPDSPSTPVAEIDTGKRIEHPDSSAYTAQASAYTSEVSGQDAKVEIQGNPIMHPQELEAEVPILPNNRQAERVNGPSDSSNDTGVSSMSPIAENGRTPMAELGVQERGLGEGRDEDDDHIVSPNSDTMPSMMERARGAPDIRISSPSVSEATWSPNSPVERRGSRFQERWS
ncbi:Candidapepsin-8 [Lachnellula suecica]|uniref:Candidapepsin-8 n=1 Tax=Lachnellula suecica TaxID=602035 RepID=A0A8T9BZZ9_9HELO|nr:Candidapepsin-8 [Lachnellula suecica]